ncbi:hypothetical protein [Oxynema aestuarii]|uniref:Uncharacterized protein n=1 Tax=Oxynema aestuarii AP17 TaxID=2064643 RepID=A0A6H1TWV8_9CYAN|nr:hypothetical protein [Oxynema aestuarii]QIZ70637.1 hypothetical protein HCG48_08640 [Oxynema aestuarii AP17]
MRTLFSSEKTGKNIVDVDGYPAMIALHPRRDRQQRSPPQSMQVITTFNRA